MVRPISIFCLLVPALSFAQYSVATQDEKNFTLQQRYVWMKSKAETYQDYKVVKEYVMDGVWKIVMDSIKKQKLLIAQERQTLSQVEADLRTSQLTLAKDREAATQVVYDSTHISVLGIDFNKSAFIILISIFIALLFFIGSAMATKMKLLRITAKEKTAIADLVTRELEEFKRKSMEKQIKLARELQNERNKVAELKENRLTH